MSLKRWGLLNAQLFQADGAGTPSLVTHSIRPSFGGNSPLEGSSLVILSTGTAAAPGQTNPSWSAFEGGTDTATNSAMPSDWLAAHAGLPPTLAGCPSPLGGTTAHDPVMLKLQIRVPTNANSFHVDSFFYAADYPEWVCSQYNDYFLALLDSGAAGNPPDKNVAVVNAPTTATYPVDVNLVYDDPSHFTQCLNGSVGCGQGATPGVMASCSGVIGLASTGFDTPTTVCGSSNFVGGGTGWFSISGNVLPGETITVRFVIWDTGDGLEDSLALLDNWQWQP